MGTEWKNETWAPGNTLTAEILNRTFADWRYKATPIILENDDMAPRFDVNMLPTVQGQTDVHYDLCFDRAVYTVYYQFPQDALIIELPHSIVREGTEPISIWVAAELRMALGTLAENISVGLQAMHDLYQFRRLTDETASKGAETKYLIG